MPLRVTVEGLNQLPNTPEVRAAIERGARRGHRAIFDATRRNLSGRLVRIASGKLSRGLEGRLRITGSRFSAVVKNTVFYGRFLEAGTRAHRIPKVAAAGGGRRRRRAHVLRFTVGGQVVFARAVQVPPLRPRHWARAALQEALPIFQRQLAEELATLGTAHG